MSLGKHRYYGKNRSLNGPAPQYTGRIMLYMGVMYMLNGGLAPWGRFANINLNVTKRLALSRVMLEGEHGEQCKIREDVTKLCKLRTPDRMRTVMAGGPEKEAREKTGCGPDGTSSGSLGSKLRVRGAPRPTPPILPVRPVYMRLHP